MRHVEELSLMQSYQDVKREGIFSASSLRLLPNISRCIENVRRLFYRWLSAARSARHRRMTLQRKEDQLKAASVTAAWQKWRERFIDEKLRPIVRMRSHHSHQH